MRDQYQWYCLTLASTHCLVRRTPGIHAEWQWADKSVLELGCGIAALPALVTSLQGARSVVCTDANESVLRLTRNNAAQFAQAHPRATTPVMAPLVWSDDPHDLRDQLRAAGVPDAPFDVILAADCIYVLDNPCVPNTCGFLLCLLRLLRARC